MKARLQGDVGLLVAIERELVHTQEHDKEILGCRGSADAAIPSIHHQHPLTQRRLIL